MVLKEFLQPSDEEVLGYDEDDDLEDEDADFDGGDNASDRPDEEEEGDNLRDWGTSKADYYNADNIETEADALEEEREARRLQQKHVQNLTEADYGFEENQWAEEMTYGDEQPGDTFTERLPELEVKEDASPDEKSQFLKIRYPEFEPLARDFVELQGIHEELSLAAKAAEAAFGIKDRAGKEKPGSVVEDMPVHKTPIATTKLRALSAYLGTIGMYFALLTSTTTSSSKALAMSPAELRDHPIVQSLFRSRQLWEQMRDVPIPEHLAFTQEAEVNGLQPAGSKDQMDDTSTKVATTSGRVATKRRTKAERAAIKIQKRVEEERQQQMEETEAKLASLDTLILAKRKEARARPVDKTANGGNDSDFGDEDALTAQEAAEKAHRKKSLRFYTSQIAQKSNKRGAASRDAGGDVDLPYKERLKDRQARLLREAERRGRSQTDQNEKLLNNGSGDDDDAEEMRLAKEIRDDDPTKDNYYDTISNRTKQKKDDKKALAQAQAQAAREGGQVYIEEEIGPDGKRAITYAIEKNKGLAPRRKKEVRNPRVKKRLQYSQKLKKLSSIRQVYRGGEGRGGYAGELTGIKTNVLKGVKL
jgi:U3 small nucleolar RNA-associated protein 3